VVVAAASTLTLVNIELGSRSVNPDVGFGLACVAKCWPRAVVTKPGSVAFAIIDRAAPAELFLESAGVDAAAPADVVKGKFVVEKVPAPGTFEIAEAWQPMQLIPVGPLDENCGSAHPLVAEVAAVAAALVTSVPTTAQSHPSHQRLESLTITLQKMMGEVKTVSKYSSLTTIAPSGTGPCRFRTAIQLNSEGEYHSFTKGA
jgi:hypothetical protein